MDCQLAGITLHYETLGDGRPLVVLPGWPDDWRVPADYLEPVFVDLTGLAADLPRPPRPGADSRGALDHVQRRRSSTSSSRSSSE